MATEVWGGMRKEPMYFGSGPVVSGIENPRNSIIVSIVSSGTHIRVRNTTYMQRD